MIEKLFIELESKTNNEHAAQAFKSSGMINRYQELGYGFFPLGYGILSSDFGVGKTQLAECSVMILGNDFGTEDYLINKCKEGRESSSNPTISNLLNHLKLDTSASFFTNFYLGVRQEGTNTNRVVSLEPAYKKLCFEFFVRQLQIIDPQFVICLGHEVRQALAEQSGLFASWKGKSTTFRDLYAQELHKIDLTDETLGTRKFIVIPHPCDTRNFTKEYVDKILQSIQD